MTLYGREFDSIKLGVIEDHSNRTRLAKLRFPVSSSILAKDQYVERMKENKTKSSLLGTQKKGWIFSICWATLKRAMKLFTTTEPWMKLLRPSWIWWEVPECCQGRSESLMKVKKLRRVVKQLRRNFEPSLNWMKDKALWDKIEKAVVLSAWTESHVLWWPAQYGWSGNIRNEARRPNRPGTYKLQRESMKKTFEINPDTLNIRVVDELRKMKMNKQFWILLWFVWNSNVRSGYLLPDT